jgi:hypothetical protein
MVSLAGLIQRGLFRTPNPTAARFALLSRAAQLGHEGARLAVEEQNQIIQQQQQQRQFQQQKEQEMINIFGGILGGVLRQH